MKLMSDPNKQVSSSTWALVAEGGGMRGVFTAGVLDSFLLANYNPFDLYIGCSAGALNLSSFIAGQYRHAWRTITTLTTRPEFYNWLRFFRGGHATDLDWLWQATEKFNPLDLELASKRLGNRTFLIGASHAEMGSAIYFQASKQHWMEYLKASCAIPALYRHAVMIDEQPLVDGGVTDPIPVYEAYRQGAKTIVVIRTHTADYREHMGWKERLVKLLLRRQPSLAGMLEELEVRYNKACDFIHNPPAGIKIIEISPEHELKTEILSRNQDAMRADYSAGTDAAMVFLQQQCIQQQLAA